MTKENKIEEMEERFRRKFPIGVVYDEIPYLFDFIRYEIAQARKETEHRVIKEVNMKLEEMAKEMGQLEAPSNQQAYTLALKDLQDWLNSKEV